MTVWFKQGVMGDLTREASRGLNKVATLYSNTGEDLFVTSIREGDHQAGSFHYRGDAFDILFGEPSTESIRRFLGPNFDVVLETDHIHIEYDPKQIIK